MWCNYTEYKDKPMMFEYEVIKDPVKDVYFAFLVDEPSICSQGKTEKEVVDKMLNIFLRITDRLN